MFSFALVSPRQRLCSYIIPPLFLDWDPPVPFTTSWSSRQFVLTIRSGSLFFRDLTDANVNVGTEEGTDDQRVVFSLIPWRFGHSPPQLLLTYRTWSMTIYNKPDRPSPRHSRLSTTCWTMSTVFLRLQKVFHSRGDLIRDGLVPLCVFYRTN